MLRVTGHDAALLDGGLRAWPGPLETGPRDPSPPGRVRAPAVAGAGRGDRRRDRRRGSRRGRCSTPAAPIGSAVPRRPIDPRPGHIPGARSAHWSANLDPATGRFLPAEALRARFDALGVRAGAPLVAYCGSGVSACANLVALERAGFGGARLYVASWSGWSSDPDRPAATGD